MIESTANNVIQKIKNLAEKNNTISVIWLYGSRVKSNASSDSDYDLAIAFEATTNGQFNSSLTEDLSYQWSKTTGKKISVIDINQAPVPLSLNVINEGDTIYCNNDLRLRAEESRVWSLWENYRYEYAKK